MGRSRNLTIAAVLILSAIAAPAGALATTGGTGLTTRTASAAAAAAAVANQRVTVSNDGITISSRSAVLLNGTLWLTGTVSSAEPGGTLAIERVGSGAGSQWSQAGTATIGSGGSFTAGWRPKQLGRFSVRVALQGSNGVSPSIAVVVYRPSIATLYGPGLWGHHTACGAVLTKATLGVANRKLPCGTEIAIYYRGRTVVAPVIDRGPYSFASWDLTMATASALGMNSTGTIGAMSVAALQH